MRWRARAWALDGLWLALLSLYVVAGYDRVPFHGDESTLIFMSGDYRPLVQERDYAQVYYTDTPADPIAQDLRILNGTVGKLAMGLAWDLAGFTAADLNQPWIWGFFDPSGEWDEWRFNVTFGHMPADDLLRAARLSSTLLLVVSVWAVWGIAHRATGRRAAAWAASLIYATHPAVLLNGRRAMMEGSLAAFSALTVLAALGLARAQAGAARRGERAAWAAALGAASGLAIASKHSALMTVAAAFVGVALEPAVREAVGSRVARWRALVDPVHVGRLAGAGVLAVAVFLLFNPAWWADPLPMPGRVLEARRGLLDGQVAYYGGYEGPGARLEGLLRQVFTAAPQYYEVLLWQEWIGGEIAAYDGAWFAGRRTGPAWGIVLAGMIVAGAVWLGRRGRAPGAWIALVWLGLTTLALLALTPLEWQRYYLPLQAPLAVTAGAGVGWGVEAAARVLRRWAGRHAADQPV